MGKVTARQKATTPSSDGELRVDKWFARAAHASQVLLLFLGVFGYFYTVLPVYQKSLLDEEIAQKTMELRAKEKQAASLGEVIARQSMQVREKEGLLRSAKTEAMETYKDLQAQLLGSVSSRFIACSHVALDKDLQGDELSRCPRQVVDGSAYLFEKLKPPDRKLLIGLLEKIARDADSDFQKIVTDQKIKLEANLSQREKITSDLAQRDKEKGSRESAEHLVGSLNLDFRLAELHGQVGRVRNDSFRAYQKLLSKASDGFISAFLNKSS